MECGNEVSEANGITHSPERRTKSRACAYQNDVTEKLSGSRIKSAEDFLAAKNAKSAKK